MLTRDHRQGSAAGRLSPHRRAQWVAPRASNSAGHKCFTAWAEHHKLPSDRVDASGSRQLAVLPGRIRLTYLELHQKPVAHTETTLVHDYLGRDRGNLDAYRGVVAAALAQQVDRARARGVMDMLSKAEVERAGTDAEAIAAEHRVDATTLQRMLAASSTP